MRPLRIRNILGDWVSWENWTLLNQVKRICLMKGFWYIHALGIKFQLTADKAWNILILWSYPARHSLLIISIMMLARPLPSWPFCAQVEATPRDWFHFLSVCINLASKLQIEPSQTYLSLFPKVLQSVLVMLIVLLSPKLLVPAHSSEYLAKIVLPVLFQV